jgi:uncharacterized membrane protein
MWFTGREPMNDLESRLKRWQSAGLLDSNSADRIRAWEILQGDEPIPGAVWGGLVALILGGLLLACGVILFVNAHWDRFGPGERFALVMTMLAVFHLGGAMARERFLGLSTALHAVGTIATGASIALVGQIFNLQEHWPAGVLLWAIAAAAGWLLLRDQAQEIFALLLIPAWMFSEIGFYSDQHIGQLVYLGRFLVVWGVLYVTFFLESKRIVTQGVLFGFGIVAIAVGVVMLMVWPWRWWPGMDGLVPFGTRAWAWACIAGVPLVAAAFKGHKGLAPPTVAIAFVTALPWCHRHWLERYDFGPATHGVIGHEAPSLLAYILLAAFAAFFIGWGLKVAHDSLVAVGLGTIVLSAIWLANGEVLTELARTLAGQLMCAATAVFIVWLGIHRSSRFLVNVGIIGFAAATLWFYFSNIFDKIGRSFGLISLGALFLLGGWALEKTRRRLLARMDDNSPSPKPTDVQRVPGGAV